MKAIRIFGRNVVNAIKSIFRNFSLSIASIICTTITLVIVALAIMVSVNIQKYTNNIKSSFTFTAYAEKDTTAEDIENIKTKLLEIKNIKGDELVVKDKEQIRKETLNKTDKDTALYNIMNNLNEKNNPLRAEFVITIRDAKLLSETVEIVKKIEKIDNIIAPDDMVNKLLPLFDAIEKMAIAIIIGLIAVTIFLICNTIKLTIYARKNEIEIMRLVGISNFVIKLPFAIEGLFLGIIGAIVPIITTIWGYTVVYDKLEGAFLNTKLMSVFPFTLYVSGILLFIGALVGMIGSYATVRRHMKI